MRGSEKLPAFSNAFPCCSQPLLQAMTQESHCLLFLQSGRLCTEAKYLAHCCRAGKQQRQDLNPGTAALKGSQQRLSLFSWSQGLSESNPVNAFQRISNSKEFGNIQTFPGVSFSASLMG